MTIIDWLIVLVPTLIIAGLACVLQRHVHSVADFMTASRVAGRYLITNAAAEMSLSVVGMVAVFEMVQQAGFAMSWWGKMSVPVGIVLTLFGFVIYRYRETRAMTLAQFFEVRYSKAFRIFAGLLGFLSGVINYGIFPALAARFFIYYCGFPLTVAVGPFTIPTIALVMVLYLTASLSLTLTGGHLTIMVTDCVGSLITMVFSTVVVITLLSMFSWTQIYTAMSNTPPGQSLLNPFDTTSVKDFNIWYILIGMFASVYAYGTWQGGSAFSTCAINAHEAKMAGILSRWRWYSQGLIYTLIPICAYTFLHHADFAEGAARIRNILDTVPENQIRTQVTTAVTLGQMLPIGVKGMVVAIFLLGLIACDGSYLHSWGGMFIQDVILPFRKKPFTPPQHLRLLRFSIFAVAAFGFTFSLLYRQTEYVLMFFAITGAIYCGGAGAVLLGGLYWKKGTTPAAWAAMLAGSTLAVGGIIMGQYSFANVPMKITALGATAVTVEGHAARQNGQIWEYDFQLMRRDEWQGGIVVATQPQGMTTNTVYYGFGDKPPEKNPTTAAQALSGSIQITPSTLTMLSPPKGFWHRFFISVRAINGQVKYFCAMVIALTLYVLISLLTCKEDFNMDRMLHRGKYAMEPPADAPAAPVKPRSKIAEWVGIDEEFTRGDRILSWSVAIWTLFWFVLFVVITVWNLVSRWPVTWWGTYWHYEVIIVPLLLLVVTTIWFWLGGVRDLIRLFKRLRTVKRNDRDDGMVVGRRNLDEVDLSDLKH